MDNLPCPSWEQERCKPAVQPSPAGDWWLHCLLCELRGIGGFPCCSTWRHGRGECFVFVSTQLPSHSFSILELICVKSPFPGVICSACGHCSSRFWSHLCRRDQKLFTNHLLWAWISLYMLRIGTCIKTLC